MATQTESRLLTAAEVAERLSISRSSLGRLVAAGRLRPIRFAERGHPRFRVEDLERLLEEAQA